MHRAYLWCITHLADVWPKSLNASMHQLILIHSSKPSFTFSLPHLAFLDHCNPSPSLLAVGASFIAVYAPPQTAATLQGAATMAAVKIAAWRSPLGHCHRIP